jgi:hypothetical protein
MLSQNKIKFNDFDEFKYYLENKNYSFDERYIKKIYDVSFLTDEKLFDSPNNDKFTSFIKQYTIKKDEILHTEIFKIYLYNLTLKKTNYKDYIIQLLLLSIFCDIKDVDYNISLEIIFDKFLKSKDRYEKSTFVLYLKSNLHYIMYYIEDYILYTDKIEGKYLHKLLYNIDLLNKSILVIDNFNNKNT